MKAGLLLLLLVSLAAPAGALDVRVTIRAKYDQSQEYPMTLLRFLLDKSGVKYTIFFTDEPLTQPRAIALLEKNEGLNLGWYGTSVELEKDLVPIRFPMWRGLLGYRVFLINKDNQPLFDRVNTVADLRKLRGDQGIGWSDVAILEHAGLKQDQTQYDAIFDKLNAGRSQYFSRGVTEAFREWEVRRNDYPNLAVEKHILLVYPFDAFFFTNKDSPELARALETGFRKAYADGSFLKFFYNHPVVKEVLDRLKDDRVRIDIPNPLMSPETLAIPKEYWHR